jgi:ABC-type transport system substrate-binding protein
MAGSYWDKFTTKRVSRRRALQGAGAASLGASAIWLVGCGSDDEDPTPSGESPTAGETPEATTEAPDDGPRILNEKNPPVPGGRLVLSTGADFGTWDAHVSVAAAANFFPQLYNLLVNQSSINPETLYFDLAESYENPDELTWNFKIRPNVMVGPNSLGIEERALTSEDVVASYNRMITDAQASNGPIKIYVDTINANGDIFELKTKNPYAYLLYRTGIFVATVPPRELLEPAGLEQMKTGSAGGGPYVLSRTTEGEIAVMDRNPTYWRKDTKNNNAQLPYREGLDVRVIRDRAAVRTAFLDGQIHIYGAESKADADDIGGRSGFFQTKDPATTFICFTMHPEKEPWLDERARKAIGFAINRQEFVDLVYNGDAEANGLVHWPMGDFAFRGDELNELQPHDVAEARALVDALGGLSFKMMYPSNSNIQQHDQHLPIFLEQMAAAGIEIEQDPQDFGTWYSNYQTLNYTSSLSLNQSYETPEVPLDFHSIQGPLERQFIIGRNDPEIQAAIDKSKQTLDLEERVQAVRDAQRLVYEKGPTLYPLVTPFSYTVYSNKFHNVQTGLGPAANALANIAAWLEA